MNRFETDSPYVRRARAGVFDAILVDLSGRPGVPERIMVDATPQGPSHGGQPGPAKRGARRIGRTRGGLNTKLHAVCDGVGRPLLLLLTRGQMSDHTGAKLLIDALPPARELVADRGYDSDRFRGALEARGIRPCIPPRRNRKHPRPWDRDIYRHRHRIENMFARLKDWRRIATRYDRCADLFRAAVVFAATGIFWLRM